MSFTILKRELTKANLSFIEKACVVRKNTTQYNPVPVEVIFYKRVKKDPLVYSLPLMLWEELCDYFPNEDTPSIYPASKFKALANFGFSGTLYNTEQRDQVTVVEQAMHLLNTRGSVLIAAYPGFGKTTSTVNLISRCNKKTVVVSAVTSVFKQWKDTIEKYTSLKAKIVRDKDKIEGADVYILGEKKMRKYSRKDYKDIGTVVVDELHLSTKSIFSQGLHLLRPQYLIGLSATPDRIDGLHKIFPAFFGSKTDYIIREETKPFVVIKYYTPFFPKVCYGYGGRIDWDTFEKSLSLNVQKQKLAVKLSLEHLDEGVLILTKRQQAAFDMEELFKKEGVTVSTAVGSKKYKTDVQVLIGGYKKLGTGFDSKANVLILYDSVKNIRQYEGRIRNHNNIVYDLVDDHRILNNHSKKRDAWLKKRGATFREVWLRPKSDDHETKMPTLPKGRLTRSCSKK